MKRRRLTKLEIAEIRAMFVGTDMTAREIAAKMGIHPSTASHHAKDIKRPPIYGMRRAQHVAKAAHISVQRRKDVLTAEQKAHIARELAETDKFLYEIAEEIGCSAPAVGSHGRDIKRPQAWAERRSRLYAQAQHRRRATATRTETNPAGGKP